MNFKKKLFIIVFMLIKFSIHADWENWTELHTYFNEELGKISTVQDTKYYYRWTQTGRNSLKKVDFSRPPTETISFTAYELVRDFDYWNLLGSPRNISETKLLANLCWIQAEYIMITKNWLEKEPKY